MTNITTYYNLGDEWTSCNGVAVKGYAFNNSGELLKEESLARYLALAKTPDALALLLSQLNGLFSAIGTAPFGLFAAVDRLRTIPLFYTTHKSMLNISDSPYTIISSCPTIIL